MRFLNTIDLKVVQWLKKIGQKKGRWEKRNFWEQKNGRNSKLGLGAGRSGEIKVGDWEIGGRKFSTKFDTKLFIQKCTKGIKKSYNTVTLGHSFFFISG